MTDAEPELTDLEREFEAMLAKMQIPRSQSAIEAVFKSSPAQMGLAAVAAAKNRRPPRHPRS